MYADFSALKESLQDSIDCKSREKKVSLCKEQIQQDLGIFWYFELLPTWLTSEQKYFRVLFQQLCSVLREIISLGKVFDKSFN